jgi:hypothetical protein
MTNNQDLASKFYSLAFSLQLRSAFIRITAFALTIAIFFVNMSWTDVSETNIVSRIASTIASALIVPGLFMVIASPLTNMAVTSLYLKARQAKGSMGHSGTGEEAEIIQNTVFTAKRKIFTASALALSILIGTFSYTMMTPSSTNPIPAPRTNIEKVANSENAWVQYDLAIRDLVEMPLLSKSLNKKIHEVMGNAFVQQLQDPIFSSLEKVAFGTEKMSEKHIDFLNKHQKAIDHLIAGAKLQKVQYFSESPNLNTPVPNLLQMRGLTNLAAAKVRHLQEQGKVQEAVELALANYKMATDVGSETNAPLISALISVVCRGIAAKSIVTLLNSGATTAEMDKEIARNIAEQNSRMLNTYQYLSSERQGILTSLEDALIKENSYDENEIYLQNSEFTKTLIKLSPGLRTRVYNKYYQLSQENLDSLRNSAESYDFAGLEKASNAFLKKADPMEWSWAPGDFIASKMFYMVCPSAIASMKSLYNDNVMAKTVISFAACSAYKKNHNEFPSTLEQAMSEIGLSTPQDAATHENIGYRLENNTPVVWFAGADGKNDGGKQAYAIEDRTKSLPGQDLIFTYGTLPFHTNK